jgi:hypothetical protein
MVACTLPVVALFQFFDSTTAVTGGILRARGKQVQSFPNVVSLSTLNPSKGDRRLPDFEVHLRYINSSFGSCAHI